MSFFNKKNSEKYREIFLHDQEFPPQLLQIPDPPAKLYLEGILPPHEHKILCVVGARKYSRYGEETCEMLIKSLSGKNISIVSGLAMGIDTIAHKAALKAKLHVLAVPGSGLGRDVLYPSVNKNFADSIIENGGGLLSEFEPDFVSTPWAFPKRNRIMAGLSHSILIIEAEKKSGTLITARLATEYNKNVLVVPGSIYSRNSEGPHLLLRLGATPITCPEDLHEALGFDRLDLNFSTSTIPDKNNKKYDDCTPEEKIVITFLCDLGKDNPPTRDTIISNLTFPVSMTNTLLSLLEMKGHVEEKLGTFRLL